MQFARKSKMLVAAAVVFLYFAFATSTTLFLDQIPKTVDVVSILCCAVSVGLIYMAYLEEKKRP